MLKLSRLNCFWPLLRKTNFAAYINKVMITDPQLNDSAIDNLCVFDFGDYDINQCFSIRGSSRWGFDMLLQLVNIKKIGKFLSI